jgi:hypothetical protein
MGAGLGFKDFTTGEVLTANDVDGYLMQGVWVFASAAARTAAVTSPQEGNMSYLKDTNSVEYYSGSAWVAVGGAATPTWTNYTPVVTAQTGSITTYTASGRYFQYGKFCTVTNIINVTNIGTAAGNLFSTLPFTAGSSTDFSGSVRETDVNGDGGTVLIPANDTKLQTRRIGAGVFWWVNGLRLVVTITYETV